MLVARRGSIADQLGSLPLPPPAEARMARRTAPLPVPSAAGPEQPTLEFFNGLGGFDKDGGEYVTVLEGSQTDACPVDQRDRQLRFRLPGRGGRQRLHLVRRAAARTS